MLLQLIVYIQLRWLNCNVKSVYDYVSMTRYAFVSCCLVSCINNFTHFKLLIIFSFIFFNMYFFDAFFTYNIIFKVCVNIFFTLFSFYLINVAFIMYVIVFSFYILFFVFINVVCLFSFSFSFICFSLLFTFVVIAFLIS